MKRLMRALAMGLMLAANLHALPAGAAGPGVSAVLSNYAALVHDAYADSLQAAKLLQLKIDAFLAQPSAQTQQGARQAWLAAREFYG